MLKYSLDYKSDLISQRSDEIINGDFDPPIVEEEFIDNVIGTVSP